MLDIDMTRRGMPEGYVFTAALPYYQDEPLGVFPTGDWATIRSLAISLAPDLATATTKMQTAIIIKNQIYSRVPMGPTPPDYNNWTNVAQCYQENVVAQAYTHECGGRTILTMLALHAFGIPTRYKGLWDSAANVNPATAFVHASSEILIGGSWLVCDGHYNITIRNNAGWCLSWMGVRDSLARGEPVFLTTDGNPQIGTITPAHYLNDVYHERLSDLLQYVATSVYKNHTGMVAASLDVSGWDGYIHYVDGTNYPVLPGISSGVYALLAQ